MIRFFFALLMVLAGPVYAASSDVVATRTLSAQLITAQDGVAPDAGTLSAGVRVVLEPGWKTYWRSPGEVGLPPELDWSASENVAEVVLEYPAPTRFTAFDIENFGYADEVVFPLQVVLAEAGTAAKLDIVLNVLVCADVCIPESAHLILDVPKGGGVDAEAAAIIAQWAAKVPDDGAASGLALDSVYLDEMALTVAGTSAVPLTDIGIFPEQGELASFGAPEIVINDGGLSFWGRLPVLNAGEGPMQITLTAGARAATLAVDLADAAPVRPEAGAQLLAMLGIALLGGLILNVMPCVLPVLSIKFASALGAAGQSRARVRMGFLASAAGVMVFFWVLAGIVLGMQASGASFGWGIQFQSPVFLSLMIVLIAGFALNLFGVFEISLPQRWTTGMATAEGKGGWGGDFATGAFAALLATPCSAPFLGTAVTYALTHGPREVMLIFSALGVGLAAPYLLIAARPGWVARMPKPGRWMVWVKGVMGALLAATALWLLSVLAVTGGGALAGAIAGVVLLAGAVVVWRGQALAVGMSVVGLILGLNVLIDPPAPGQGVEGAWAPFEEAAIAAHVARGDVVFVDVTADWCLTCKANKKLVLEVGDVAQALEEVTLMRADWTRPSDTILAYLQANGRFGIPFNKVYGPAAPEGIALPELLTQEAVLLAISSAGAVRE